MSTISEILSSPPNNFSTTLSGNISSSAITIGLNNVTGLGTEGVGVIYQKDSDGNPVTSTIEFIHWTGISSLNLTLSDTGDRGITGSASGAQSHSSGDTFEVWVHSAYYILNAVTKTAVQTLTNKTLTSPKIDTAINDTNGNEIIKTPATASAVNEITVTNAATGNPPQISATGGDTNIGITLTPKGTGAVNIGTAALKFPNTDGTSGQFLKTDGSGTLSFGEASSDGWVTSPDTWVYASASTFTIAGVDRTSVFTPGTRLKFTQTSAKYAVVASSSFSTDTTVTIAVNTDYTIANAAITSPYYSYEANPQGYPSWFTYSPSETWTNPPTSRTTTCKYSVVDRKVTMLWGTNGTANAANSSSVITLTIPINHAAITTTRHPVLGSFMWTDNSTFTDFGAVYSTAVGTITGDCGQTTRKPTIVNISASWQI